MFFGMGKKEIVISSPVSGKVKPVSSLKDKTFSADILGPGIAVAPEGDFVEAPADGKLEQMFETGHAFGMTTAGGVELLVHVGLDTVRLKGRHFKKFGKSGDSVKKGDRLIEFDENAIRGEGYDTTVVLVVLNQDRFKGVRFAEEGPIRAGDPLIWVKAK
jgi:glucose-specific phosphotransferase system IIA component